MRGQTWCCRITLWQVTRESLTASTVNRVQVTHVIQTPRLHCSDGEKRYRAAVLFPHSGYSNENEEWIHNEAHGGLFGVYLNKDGLPGCSLVQSFFVWRSYDYGIYFQVLTSYSSDFFHSVVGLTVSLHVTASRGKRAGRVKRNWDFNHI